jgi:exodeoxyribonuclease III
MKKTRILSWNVNGLRAVQRKGFSEWLARERPDILCLQETKVNEEQLTLDQSLVEGYRSYFSSAERKGYSGVALYTKKEPAEVWKGFGVARFDQEGRTLIADYGSFVLFDIYFPNGKMSAERLRYKLEFYDAFLEAAEGFRKQGRGVVVCGDFNTAHREIDLARPRENSKVSGFLPQERAWLDKLVSSGYLDTFRMFSEEPGHYSWWDLRTGARARDIGWRIDYFFVSEELRPRVKSAFILKEVEGSDHCPVGIELMA